MMNNGTAAPTFETEGRIETETYGATEQRWLLSEDGSLRIANLGYWMNDSDAEGWTPDPQNPDVELWTSDRTEWERNSRLLADTLS